MKIFSSISQSLLRLKSYQFDGFEGYYEEVVLDGAKHKYKGFTMLVEPEDRNILWQRYDGVILNITPFKNEDSKGLGRVQIIDGKGKLRFAEVNFRLKPTGTIDKDYKSYINLAETIIDQYIAGSLR